jgi:subfamily B ATP-binding cassette protein HlyB/CyaB
MSNTPYTDDPARFAATIGLSLEHFLWVAGSLCQLVQRAFDPALSAQQHPPPLTVASLQVALGSAEFRCMFSTIDWTRLEQLPTPAVVFVKVEPQESSGAQLRHPALLLKADADRVLIARAGQQQPEVMTRSQFATGFESFALLTRYEPTDRSRAVDPSISERSSFGFRWFWDEALRHRSVWAEVIIASAVITLLGLAVPLATQVILDKVVVHETYSTLSVIAGALVISVVFTALMSWLRQYLVNHTGTRVDAALTAQVFSHLLKLPVRYFEHRPTGTIVARLQGVETVREFITGAAVTLILDLPMMVIFIAFMVWYSWQLSLIAVGGLLLITVLSIAITPALRRRLDTEFLLGARNQAFLTEYVRGVETVKSLAMEPRTEQRFGEYIATHLAASFATRQLGNTYGVTSSAIEQAMGLAILCVGALFVMQGDGFTVGMLVAFQMFASRLAQPMLRMVGLWQQFQQADIAVKRLADLMDTPTEPYATGTPRAMQGPGAISIRGLAFRHSERHPLLYRDFSLDIEPGSTTVIRGPSGSGKSTLAKLLLGLYVPNEGRILIDGCDIASMGVDEVRRLYGVVPQETMLFSNTIYANLIDAAPHATAQDVVAACTLAEIHAVIEQLPQGYETVVGEQGAGLSGGQRQRIAIARALLRRPRVLLFDEATSHLDRDTAEHFAKTVNRLRGRHTILFIAHHVPAALKVDREVGVGAFPG